MEALTDRELGLIDPESGDGAPLNAAQPTEEALDEPTHSAEPAGWPLPLSQSSGSDLPASQPQPLAPGDADDEDLTIEDYESDGA